RELELKPAGVVGKQADSVTVVTVTKDTGIRIATQANHMGKLLLKRFVMMDKTSGIWLLHSTPTFPYKRESNSFFPASGKTNGQTFICVTFPYDRFKDMYQYIKAPIFEHHIPNDFHQSCTTYSVSTGAAAVSCEWLLLPTIFRIKSSIITDCCLMTLCVFVLFPADGDLYVTIADTIKSNVHVQTWGRQSGRSGNYESANRYHVLNVECISIDSRLWKPSHDHSKWCVSNSGDWTCIADSNRAESQFNRPGGALCINNKGVTDIFKSFIKGKSDCPYGSMNRRPSVFF
uniref:Deoxyribonuclease-2-alpha n=1 Tax=Sparus aurata TaxID=8175 RepID=A0A671UV18_SPAAU